MRSKTSLMSHGFRDETVEGKREKEKLAYLQDDLRRIAVGSSDDTIGQPLAFSLPAGALDGSTGKEPGKGTAKQMDFPNHPLLRSQLALVSVGTGQEIELGTPLLATFAQVASQQLTTRGVTSIDLVVGQVVQTVEIPTQDTKLAGNRQIVEAKKG